MSLPDYVQPYEPAPEAVTGSPFLREAILARLAARHGAGSEVLCISALDADAWACHAAEAMRAAGGGRHVLFDVLSRDHRDAYENLSGGPAPPPVDGGQTPLRARDLVAACERLGVCVRGVFPYGIVASGIAGTLWHRGTLAGLATWERLLSWVKRDRTFHDFVLILEDIAHDLCSDAAARFVIALEDRADPAVNALWLERDARLRAALQSGFRRESIEPLVGVERWAGWREGLRALRHPPSLIAAFRLLDTANSWKYPVDLDALLEPGFVNDLTFLTTRKRADDAMWRFINSVQDDPELRALLEPRPGIAPHFEFELLRPLANAVLKLA